MKLEVEKIIPRLKQAMEGEDVNEIKKVTEELNQANHKIAETLYGQASDKGSQHGSHESCGGNCGTGNSWGSPDSGPDDVVDADYREVA